MNQKRDERRKQKEEKDEDVKPSLMQSPSRQDHLKGPAETD